MSTGIFMLVELASAVDEDALNQKRHQLLQYVCDLLDDPLENSAFYANKPLERIPWGDWITTVPEVPFYQTSNGTNWLDVHINLDAYEPGYQRGDLLLILKVASELDKLFPGCQLWYGNDCFGDPDPFGDEVRELLLTYWKAYGNRDRDKHSRTADQDAAIDSYYRKVREWRTSAHKRPNAVKPNPTNKFHIELKDKHNWLLSGSRRRRILKLIKLLDQAEQTLRQGQWDVAWAAVDSADDLADELLAYQDQFRRDDFSMLPTARSIFLPTGPWDEARCISGCNKPPGLAQEIEQCMQKIKR